MTGDSDPWGFGAVAGGLRVVVRGFVRAGRLVVVDPCRRAVHRISSRDAERALDGEADGMLGVLGEEVTGVGLAALERDPIGRRRVTEDTALAGLTGIVTMWLPSAASESSVGGAPTGEGFARSVTYTATDADGGTLSVLDPGGWTGDTFQVVAEGAGGGQHTNGVHAPGRGRRVGVNLDRTALATASLVVVANAHAAGATVAGGGGNGGQAVALRIVDGATLLVAGGGGGAGQDGAGGDADSDAGSVTSANGSLSGGAAPTGGERRGRWGHQRFVVRLHHLVPGARLARGWDPGARRG